MSITDNIKQSINAWDNPFPQNIMEKYVSLEKITLQREETIQIEETIEKNIFEEKQYDPVTFERLLDKIICAVTGKDFPIMIKKTKKDTVFTTKNIIKNTDIDLTNKKGLERNIYLMEDYLNNLETNEDNLISVFKQYTSLKQHSNTIKNAKNELNNYSELIKRYEKLPKLVETNKNKIFEIKQEISLLNKEYENIEKKLNNTKPPKEVEDLIKKSKEISENTHSLLDNQKKLEQENKIYKKELKSTNIKHPYSETLTKKLLDTKNENMNKIFDLMEKYIDTTSSKIIRKYIFMPEKASEEEKNSIGKPEYLVNRSGEILIQARMKKHEQILEGFRKHNYEVKEGTIEVTMDEYCKDCKQYEPTYVSKSELSFIFDKLGVTFDTDYRNGKPVEITIRQSNIRGRKETKIKETIYKKFALVTARKDLMDVLTNYVERNVNTQIVNGEKYEKDSKIFYVKNVFK